MSDIILETRGLSFSYKGGPPIIDELDFSVRQGQWLTVMGPSGCGKSTLLYCLCGIIPEFYSGELKGEVLLMGRPLQQYSRSELACIFGFVFQNPCNRLFCSTVEQEIFFGLQNLCLPRQEIISRTDHALKVLGIEYLRRENPTCLSGGQQQLVALASALAMDARILLLDEALSQVDEQGGRLILEKISGLKELGRTIIMVEHNQENARFADKIIHLQGGGVYA